MKELNLQLMEVMRLEAKSCFERGDMEDGRSLCESIFQTLIPHLIEESKSDPYYVKKLISMTNSDDEVESVQAFMILKILKDKGVLDLIYAINLLEQSFKDKIILKLYGKIDTQNPAHINENDFKKYLIPDLIEWEGFTSEIKHILEKSDIYCLPSYREGIPKSIVEAMAIGRPILTTNAPGCEDTVEEGINGFKVNICDAKALSKKLQKLVEEKELRIEMGKKSRVFFEKYF